MMREMILQLHSVLYVAKLSKMGRLGQALREMQKKLFYWINLVVMFEGICSMHIKTRPARNSAGNLQRWSLEALTRKDQLLLLKLFWKDVYNELSTNFSIHDAITILSKLSVSETAFSGVWKVLDQFLVLPAMNASFREVFFSTKVGKNLFAHNHDTRMIKKFDDFACSQWTS